jgi:hypothetical protein
LDQFPWWSTEVETAWLDKRRAVGLWQSAKNNIAIHTNQILALKQAMNMKVDLFKTLVKQVKKWAMFCERIIKDRSLKLFWRVHKRYVHGVVINICVRNFESSDLSWKKTDEDMGNALLSHYLERSDQKDKMRRTAAKDAIDRLWWT